MIPVNRYSIQIKIGLLMFVAVVLVSAAGYLTYRNLSSIVSSIQIDLKPDPRFTTIRELSMDLEKAQNSIRIYTNTHNTADLRPYYAITGSIDNKVKLLRSQCKNDSLVLLQTDTIRHLISKNIEIWNELVTLHSNHTVSADLRELTNKLDSSSSVSNASDKNILRKIFTRTDKNKLGEKEIANNLRFIEQQDSITKNRLVIRESVLAITSNELKDQLYELITKIENEISGIVNKRAASANDLAEQTYLWLALFSISGTLLAMTVVLIIIRYVRKTQVYQVALQKSRDEAEKLARTKELFMANMSHEIRTPVTAISGFTEQLLHEAADEKTSRSLSIIKSSSDNLIRIINDILDFSKLQNGRLLLEKVNYKIAAVMEEVYSLFEKQALRNGTVLSYETDSNLPVAVYGDPYRLKQILINLVSNAVKFTKDGKVRFSIMHDKAEKGLQYFKIEVSDTGIGIDESKIDYIFEDFTQEEMSTTRKYGGTGLGLSIVKRLVELHGGTITCKSRKNEGTVITCIIPYEQGDENAITVEQHDEVHIPDELRNMRVLIVDDEEYNRLLFRTILTRWNVRNSEVSSGVDALELLKSEKFDILFMDERMPGIDGLKATKFIREEMKISREEMPVICITAALVNDDWNRYREAGMNASLPKPFSEQMLLNAILPFLKNVDHEMIVIQADKPVSVPEETTQVDLKNLYHISGGDESFVKQMLQAFIETTEKGFEDISVNISQGNSGPVAETAHKLMPPCRHIGAVRLAKLLGNIELEIKGKNDMLVLSDLADQAKAEFEQVSRSVKHQIEKIG